jgi:hypothetical protein
MIPTSKIVLNNIQNEKILKRKRFFNIGDGNDFNNFRQDDENDIDEDLDEDEEIEELALDDNNSNKSDSSSTSSNNSTSTLSTSSVVPVLKIKKSKIKHGHKVLILEDNNMSEALNHLQIEVDNDEENKSHVNHKLPLLHSSNSIEDEENDEDQENESAFIISDQLKKTLKTYQNYDEYLLSKVSNEQNNNLQLILWRPPPTFQVDDENDPTAEELFSSAKSIPSTSKTIPSKNTTNDSMNELNYYTVEEPIDQTKSQKCHLKRSYSQVSKISIEELKHLNNISNTSQSISANHHHFLNGAPNHQVQFYLVDEMDDQKMNNIDQSKSVYNQMAVNNLNIRDVTSDDNVVVHFNHAHPGSCEKMDIF